MFALLLIGAGCKKYLDINKNPSVPQKVNAEILLPPIIYQMANGTSQDYRLLWKLTQNMVGVSTDASSINWEKHGYVSASDAGGVIWRMVYVDLGLNLENMLQDAIENKKYEYVGIGYAIKAWAYQMATDLYGPIILDKAFDETLLRFPYQDQPDVYAKVREWSQLSIKYLNMTSPVSVDGFLKGSSGDFIYKGDKAKWKKFVYALLALQYSHLRNKPEFATQYADSVIKYTDMSFVSESESALVQSTNISSTDGAVLGPGNLLLRPTSTTTYYGRPTTTIINYLTGGVRGLPLAPSVVVPPVTNPVTPASPVDPRLSRMIPPSTTASTLGQFIGVTPASAAAPTGLMHVYGPALATIPNYMGYYLFTDGARYPIMTYSQLQFAKAEALLVKGLTGPAYIAYINGIKGHMDFVNLYGRTSISATLPPAITVAERDAYLASSEVAPNASALTITDIMGQKYIAQWGWAGLEQWCDLRKYHYDAAIFKQYTQLTAGQLYRGKYAYRFRPRYNSEYVWNQDELAKWGALNSDYMTYETWFSQP